MARSKTVIDLRALKHHADIYARRHGGNVEAAEALLYLIQTVAESVSKLEEKVDTLNEEIARLKTS